jgi:hypothetical protein
MLLFHELSSPDRRLDLTGDPSPLVSMIPPDKATKLTALPRRQTERNGFAENNATLNKDQTVRRCDNYFYESKS